MRVPTYKAQTRLTQQVGGRAMGVRYTADDFGAGVARAQGQLFQDIGDAALAVNEKQRRATEEEQRISNGLAKDKAINEFLEGSELAAEEAKNQPIESQESYYDEKIAELKTRLQGGFAEEVDRADVGIRFDRIAIGKRTNVRANANTARIEGRIAEKAKQENIYVNSAINAQGAELEGTINDLAEMYEGMVKDGLMTADDAARRQKEVQDKILFEREVNTANLINDPVKAQEFITRIEADERFDPTVRRRLAAMVSGVLAGKENTLKAHKSQFTDDIASLNDVVSAGVPIPEGDLEKIMETGRYLDKVTGDTKYSRDAQQIFEANENTKIFAQNTSIDAIDAVISQAEDAARGEFVSIEERGYAADRASQAKTFKAEMQSAYTEGNGLDFLQKVSPGDVQSFDFSDFSGSLARRQNEMRNLNGKVGYDSFTNKPLYEQKFFTKEEAVRIGQLISNADPESLASYAVAFQQAGRKNPQIWEQIAGTGIDGQIFSMAGAINRDGVAETIFKGNSMLKADSSLKPSINDYLPEYEDIVGDTYMRPGTSGETNATVKNAVIAHYIGSGGSRTEFDQSLFQHSIDAVTGGIGTINGKKLELPPEVSEELFQTLIDEMTPEMLREKFAPNGFDHLNLSDEGAIEKIQQGRIVTLKSGRYGVVDKGSGLPILDVVALDGTRQPFEFEIDPKLQIYLKSKGVGIFLPDSKKMYRNPMTGQRYSR